jgi:hypothetical protein
MVGAGCENMAIAAAAEEMGGCTDPWPNMPLLSPPVV